VWICTSTPPICLHGMVISLKRKTQGQFYLYQIFTDKNIANSSCWIIILSCARFCIIVVVWEELAPVEKLLFQVMKVVTTDFRQKGASKRFINQHTSVRSPLTSDPGSEF